MTNLNTKFQTNYETKLQKQFETINENLAFVDTDSLNKFADAVLYGMISNAALNNDSEITLPTSYLWNEVNVSELINNNGQNMLHTVLFEIQNRYANDDKSDVIAKIIDRLNKTLDNKYENIIEDMEGFVTYQRN